MKKAQMLEEADRFFQSQNSDILVEKNDQNNEVGEDLFALKIR